MIDIKEKLTVIFEDAGTLTNISSSVAQFKDEITTQIDVITDNFLYIGFYKPIKNFYIHFDTPTTDNINVFLQVFDGESWIDVVDFIDETNNFTKSGFISCLENSRPAEVDGNSLYFFRFRFDGIAADLKLGAVSMLLCSINDISAVYPPVIQQDFRLGKQSLHVALELSKNNIIQYLRNKGINTNDNKRLTVFDLLDVQEVRQAAAYKTISQILLSVFNSPEDKFYILSEKFKEKAEELLKTYMLSIDYNQTGENNQSKFTFNSMRLVR